MAKSPSAAARDARQNFHLQFVSTPTADTPGTMAMLYFPNKRYMFGRISEGTQRACVQRGTGLKKVRNIFITGVNAWENNGGLIGLMLTLADQQQSELDDDRSATRPRLNIHGGPKLLHTVACARRFVFRTGVPLAIHESTAQKFQWPSEPSFVDENIRVWPIAVPGSSSTANGQTSGASIQGVTEVEADQARRHQVVSDMFDSEWRRDRLIETPFAQVSMPATVWIRDSRTKQLKGTHCINMDDAPHIPRDKPVLVRNPWPASLVGQLPQASNLPHGVAMSYIFKGYTQRGAFDNGKAKEAGVPFGPIRSKLTAGESVTLEDGRIITPEMVLGPPKPGVGAAFFDVPTLGHLEYLSELVSSTPGMLDDVKLAVWTLGHGVGVSEQLRSLVCSLNQIEHLAGDPDTAPNVLAFDSVAASSIRLSKISPPVFPVPVHNNIQPYEQSGISFGKLVVPLNGVIDNLPPKPSVPAARAGLKVVIEPKYTLDYSEVPEPMTPSTAERADSDEYLKALNVLGDNSISAPEIFNEPEITCLGTGSAQPSKYRNVSATLLRMPNGQGNYLFDCGENTLGQLRRVFPAGELQDILCNLKAIWISHLHADHHLGTISILQERAKAFDRLKQLRDRTIYMMSEQNKIDFLREYSSVEPSLIENTGLVPIVCVADVGPTLDGEVFNFPQYGSAISKVQTARVSHCIGAQAISITFKSGFKISYSGDCRPSSHFCRIGQDSDVLIHEATFDDGLEGDARAKKHSTTSEALGVALRMRAKNVVLTHFSQRYQKVPNLDNVKLPDEIEFEEGSHPTGGGPVDETVDAQGENPDEPMDRTTAMSLDADFLDPESAAATEAANADAQRLSSLRASRERQAANKRRRAVSVGKKMAVCVAFDYMRVRVSQIKECKKLYPVIQAMFEDMERKSESRRAEERRKLEEHTDSKKGKKATKQDKNEKQGKQEKGKGQEKEKGKEKDHIREKENPEKKEKANEEAGELNSGGGEKRPSGPPNGWEAENAQMPNTTQQTSGGQTSPTKSKGQLKRELKKERSQNLKRVKAEEAARHEER